jgi:phosphatidylserine/phosphatidylglycerophosphate/cardiolipin synthase-like enzyme
MAVDPLSRADAALGDALERAMIAHHRRRLDRLGRRDALIPASPGQWATTGTTPPREGNALEVLIDGAQGLPAMAEAIRGAQSHVHVCSWHLEADFAPERDGAARSRVRELLA